MCGIAGFYSPQLSTSEAQNVADKICKVLTHRGPDDFGVWNNGSGLWLIHRRLSILDLSPLGHQPMISTSQKQVLVFNGEIYNYLELRKELEDKGVKFRGHSDTEVLLEGIELWGLNGTLKKIKGMFGFAIWDSTQNILSLARDRMGEKPVYFSELAAGGFVFGSEMKAIVQHPDFIKEMNPEAISLFFQLNYIPSPHTIFKNCRKLPPGSFIQWTVQGGVSDIQKFWNYPEPQSKTTAAQDDSQVISEFKTRLEKSVKDQLHSDVPVGCFLSGGIDSATIASTMQSLSKQKIKTYTIGFSDSSYDESKFAKEMAQHLGTDHHEWILSPDEAKSMITLVPDIYDEPFADSSQLPTSLLSKLTSSQVKVVLSGDGGDELLGGYNRYLWTEKLWNQTQYIPFWAKSLISSGIGLFSENFWNEAYKKALPILPKNLHMATFGNKIHKFKKVLSATDPMEIYRNTLTHWSQPPLQQKLNWTLKLPDLGQENFTAQMMRYDSQTYLPDDLMVKVDRASMAFSLETRAPFLDHELIEFSAQLPMSYKIRNGQTKWLLRQILLQHMPLEMFERPKQGFAIPIADWLRTDLKDWAESLLSDQMLREQGLFDVDRIRDMWKEHLMGRHNWGLHLWDVLVFQMWWSKWMLGKY